MKGAARRAATMIRQTPAGSRLVDRSVNLTRARALRRAGLVDREYYEAQTGRSFGGDAAALEHYLADGRHQALSLSPLFSEAWYAATSGAGTTDRLLSLFFGFEPLVSTSPLFDAARWAAEQGEGSEATASARAALLTFLATAQPSTRVPTHMRGLPDLTWGELRDRAIRLARPVHVAVDPLHPVDWESVSAQEREETLVSIVIPTFQDWELTRNAVDAVLDNSEGHRIEVVVVDNGSDRAVQEVSAHLYDDLEHVRYLPLERNLNFASGSNVGFAASRGARVVFLNNDTTVQPGWLAPLLKELEDPDVRGVQPLLVYPDRRVQAAGTVFAGPGIPPWHFLAGHAVSDVLAAGQTRFAAVTAATLAMRAEDVIRARGFDPAFVNGFEDVDLCLRLGGGDLVFGVALASRVIHHESRAPGRMAAQDVNRRTFYDRWSRDIPETSSAAYAAAGLEVQTFSLGQTFPTAVRRDAIPRIARRPRLVDSGPWAGREQLRWAIKLAAADDPGGDLRDDARLAESIAEALRTHGQEVVVDRLESVVNPAENLEQVVLALRTDVVIPPNPLAVNMLWLLAGASPTATEVRAFDVVVDADPTAGRVTEEVSLEPVIRLRPAGDALEEHVATLIARAYRRREVLGVRS